MDTQCGSSAVGLAFLTTPDIQQRQRINVTVTTNLIVEAPNYSCL